MSDKVSKKRERIPPVHISDALRGELRTAVAERGKTAPKNPTMGELLEEAWYAAKNDVEIRSSDRPVLRSDEASLLAWWNSKPKNSLDKEIRDVVLEILKDY